MSEFTDDNLINKVNAVNNRWVDYEGNSRYNNKMVQAQFIPYQSDETYEVNYPVYVSYYNGDEFIKTELNKETPDIIDTVEEADGLTLSFNKENKSEMQLTKIE